MSGWNKLFSSITESSVWIMDDKTLRVWIAMLARANAAGIVEGSVPGFASLCRMSLPKFEECLAKLMAPDPHSRTKEHEGRRIEEVPGGWRVINHAEYNKRGQERDGSRAPYMRQYMRNYRQRVNTVNNPTANVSPEAEAEAEADKYKDVGQNETRRSAVASPASDEDWLRSLTVNPAYAGLDVRREFQKMTAWCEVNRKQPSRRRFINWLNRAEKPMNRPKQGGLPGVEDYR